MLVRTLLLLNCCWCVSLAAAPGSNSHISDSQCKVLRVSGAIGWYPVLMKPTQGEQLEGVSIALINKVSHVLKLPVEFIHYPCKRALRNLESGSLDLILGIYKTHATALLYQYSPAIMLNQARIFTRVDKPLRCAALKT